MEKCQEYVVIPYHFEDGLDNTRKEAFRIAVQRWHGKTCIALVEQDAASITRPFIKAGSHWSRAIVPLEGAISKP